MKIHNLHITDHVIASAGQVGEVDHVSARAAQEVAYPTGRYGVASGGLSRSGALRIVGVLAFGQSLLFLVIWLWLCASAGAATPATDVQVDMQLQLSTYSPAKIRDPFGKSPVVRTSTTVEVANPASFLQLQGILYDRTNPAAMVSDHLMTLNKTVTFATDEGEFQARAVEITRDRVVLEAGGSKVTLRLSGASSKPPAQ